MKNLVFVLFPLKKYRLGRNDPSTFDFWRDTMTRLKVGKMSAKDELTLS